MGDKLNRETSKELKGGGGYLKAEKKKVKKVVKYDNMTTTCIKNQRFKMTEGNDTHLI